MSLINVALPMTSFTFAHPWPLGNHVLAGKWRTPSLRMRSSSLATRCCSSELVRSDFPSSFKFGASSCALQTEGYADEGGRGPSTWDYMLGDLPAVQSYTKYKEDVWCLKNMNANGYRMSISWSRILPTGRKSGGINQEGIDFYNKFFDELIENGIEPVVTLVHFEIPSGLQEEYNSVLSSQFVDDFNDYADICFKTFGDKIKYWTTFNEPSVYCQNGYQEGMSGEDNPARYPYIAGHNILLAHATAVKTYRDKYQPTQNGKIGLSSVTTWLLPLTDTPADISATHRLWDFIVGWFVDPIVTGDYPFSMRSIVRDRLPEFTDEQRDMLKGSYDFLGINYYTSKYAKGLPFSVNDVPTSYSADTYVESLFEKDGVAIGPTTAMDAMYVYPQGLSPILLNLKLKYNDPEIYITENGIPQERDDSLSIEEALQDDERVEYVKGHMLAIREGLRNGVNVNGYFVWTLMDNMEVLGEYYTKRFGLNYTDYSNDFKRIPKKSATWLKDFLSTEESTTSVQEITEKIYVS